MGVLALSVAFVGSALAADGAAIFKSKCMACHGADGGGMAGLAPSLKASEFVKTSAPDVIAQTIVDGRAGDQKTYKNLPLAMPPQKGILTDAEVSAVVAYIKSLAH
jgi:mono/diheme cytochrome c family protein